MVVTNSMRTPILLLSLLLLAGIAISGPRDAGGGPNGIAPSSQIVSPGTSVALQITLNATTTSDQVVSLTSTSPEFAVPSTVTVPAGSSVAYSYGIASPTASMTSVSVTASCNGYSASCNVGIVP